MSRAPYQVLVLPFRSNPQRGIEYAAFRRSDDGKWQGIAGGGEEHESPAEAAVREAWEEAGIPAANSFYRLRSVASIPACCFEARQEWGPGVDTIPEYAFAVDSSQADITISPEHSQVMWGA